MDRRTSRLKNHCLSVALATALLAGGGTVASVAFSGVPAALAQDQSGTTAPAGPPQGGRGNRMGKMLMSLNLSDAQKTQIRAIIADARKQNQSVTDRDQKRANMKAAYAKVETVLTPAQRTELHAKMEAMHQQQQDPAQHPQ
jgi:Spy/CpxP family protein refolding chaperone